MQKNQLSPGIWLNPVSDRFCTITSTLPNATPDWRIAYYGFDKWSDATGFAFRLKRLRDSIRCESRRSKRLSTKFEVKVWSLSKEEARTFWTELEGNVITFVSSSNGSLLSLVLNGQRVVSILPCEQNYAIEFAATLKGLTHARAREKIANRFLILSNAA